MDAPDHVAVPAGHVIYSEGDTGDHMYGIVEGRVSFSKGAVVIAELGPDDVFGERALIDHLPRNVTAVATSDTTLAEIDQRLSHVLVHESPTFALGIMGAHHRGVQVPAVPVSAVSWRTIVPWSK
jgi:CRP-like cAMP-binding protein